MTGEAHAYSQTLGEKQSVWFKISPFVNAEDHVEGALWQKVRQPQHPYFHPDVYAVSVPFLLTSLNKKMGEWASLPGRAPPSTCWRDLQPAVLRRDAQPAVIRRRRLFTAGARTWPTGSASSAPRSPGAW